MSSVLVCENLAIARSQTCTPHHTTREMTRSSIYSVVKVDARQYHSDRPSLCRIVTASTPKHFQIASEPVIDRLAAIAVRHNIVFSIIIHIRIKLEIRLRRIANAIVRQYAHIAF
jgi:hypothetical protein